MDRHDLLTVVRRDISVVDAAVGPAKNKRFRSRSKLLTAASCAVAVRAIDGVAVRGGG